MNLIPLAALPNQNFSVQLGNDFYDISINQTRNTVCMTIYRNNVLIISGQRLVAGFAVIPYAYLESGNFFLLTENDDLPDYQKFGVTQYLIYVGVVELALAKVNDPNG